MEYKSFGVVTFNNLEPTSILERSHLLTLIPTSDKLTVNSNFPNLRKEKENCNLVLAL